MKPVDRPEFWKERIDGAVKEHYSVYISSDNLWKDIEKCHKEIIEKEIPKGSKVLDAGCGYGRLSEWFDNYTGVDFSPDFIARAEMKYPDKKFVQADLKKLPFKDREFDFAICVSIKNMIIGNLGTVEWWKMEKELKRVAHKVLILEYGDYERNGGLVKAKKYEIL